MRRVVVGLIVAVLLVVGLNALPEPTSAPNGQNKLERLTEGAKWAISSPSASRPTPTFPGRDAATRQITEGMYGMMVTLSVWGMVGFITPRR